RASITPSLATPKPDVNAPRTTGRRRQETYLPRRAHERLDADRRASPRLRLQAAEHRRRLMPLGAIDTEALVAAVTEPTRRQIVDLLLERGESTATALADSLPITPQAVSKHLAVLTRVGLVEGEKSGREMRYRLNVERLDRVTRSLGE